MANDERHFYCAFDVCEKRLKEFCFICEQNGRYYCDEICCERDLEAYAPKQEAVIWH